MRLYRTVPLVLILFFATAAHADEVLLANGDRLTGTVVRKEGDELIFKTSYAGEIKIAWSQIARILSDEPMRLVLSNHVEPKFKQSDPDRESDPRSGASVHADRCRCLHDRDCDEPNMGDGFR